jgi:hypothetical protein
MSSLKKSTLLILLSCITTHAFAIHPMQRLFEAQHKPLKSSSEVYPDFSGHWVGTCHQESGDTYEETLTINQNETTLTLNDKQSFTIDGLTKGEQTTNMTEDGFIFHLHWNTEASALIGSFVRYSNLGLFSQNRFQIFLGKLSLRFEGTQLIETTSFTSFLDGEPQSDTLSYTCVYTQTH